MNRPKGLRVAVIGGGLGGIAAGVMLRKAGIRDFTIFEKSSGFGGTWWENTYPGAEVDTPSVIYSYSFNRYPWSRTHAEQSEILRYINYTVDSENIRENFRLSTAVKSVRWSDKTNQYMLSLEDGSAEIFDAVISAVGFLNTPKIPDFPGIEKFAGRLFHTARWPKHLDLTGKRVAVIGTGSTSVQVVNRIAANARQVLIFQRQPNWILPKNARDHTHEDLERLSSPWRYRLARIKGFIDSENGRIGGKDATNGTRANTRKRNRAEQHLRSVLKGRPDLIEAALPDYPFYGKRPVINDDFYATLREPNVRLIPRACASFDERHVIDSDGTAHEVDVVVMATGFQASNYLANISIYGRSGRELHDYWNGEPTAFLGIAVPEFPNFFMLYGPNTNSGPVTFFLECQAEFAVSCLKRMLRSGAKSIEARSTGMKYYDRWVQKRLSKTVWGGAANYFKSASGRVVTQWPTGATQYWLLTHALRRIGMRTADE